MSGHYNNKSNMNYNYNVIVVISLFPIVSKFNTRRSENSQSNGFSYYPTVINMIWLVQIFTKITVLSNVFNFNDRVSHHLYLYIL